MAPRTLPPLIVLGSESDLFDKFKKETTMFSRLYLGCVPNGSDYQNCLKYDFKASDPAAKFAVEPAKSGGLVHIRCCYNKKYWCRKDGNTQAIVAEASEPVEDKTTWKCTLFEAKTGANSDGEQTVVFRHVQTNTDLHLADINYDRPKNYLTTNDTYRVAKSVSVNYDSLLMLPKNVVFQGYNERYLRSSSNTALTFTETDLSSEWVVQTVYQTGDGKVRFINKKLNDFWTFHAYLDIKADAYSGGYDYDYTLFKIIDDDVKNGIIIVRCLSNKKFCKADGNPLRASADTIVREAKLRVLEPVRKRTIRVKFHLDKATIYDETPTTMAEASGKNDSYTETDELSLQKLVEYTESQTWAHTLGVKTGVETSLETGIPKIAEGKITISTEISYEHQWSKTEENKESTTAMYTMKIEPRHKGTIKMVSTKGHCDIPFSYTQTDNLYNGQTVVTELSDGIYNGVKYYGFHYETFRESIDNKKLGVERKVIVHSIRR